MDINAKFTADFTEFNTGVVAAEEKLKGIETQTDATTAKLGELPAALNATTTAAQGAAGGTNSLAGSLGQVDKVLGLAGINIGKTVGALKELGGVAGKTAGEVGLLGTGLASVGAFLIGWNIGRPIAAFFDLDRKIGDATARLLGFGDVAAEVAGAQLDELTRASQRAGRAITDLAEARKINAAAINAEQLAQRLAKEAHDAELESLKKILALDLDWHETLRTLTQAQKEQIESLITLGAETEDIARVEKVTENQVEAVRKAMEERKKASDAYGETIKKVQGIENGQLTGRITGLNELGRLEEVQSDARIARILKEVKAFEDAMDREAAAAKKFNAEREGGGPSDPIQAAAEERDAAMARANQRWPGGGPDLNAIYQAVQTKFQDAINNIGKDIARPGFNTGQVPFSQLAPQVNVNVSLDGRALTSAISTNIIQGAARQWPSR